MDAESRPDLARVAKAFADDSRAAIMVALMDGRAWTAAELAAVAGVARNTTSGHLDRLLDAGLATQVRQGRHRYIRLSDQRVAAAVEALAEIAGRRPPARSFRGQRAETELVAGRTCYRHLAGCLGVALADEWKRLGVVSARRIDAVGI